MTSRAQRDPAGRKRAIVDAAAELIIEAGFNDVTHRKVAERAGVPLGSTTQYFTSLDDLRGQALEKLATFVDDGLVGLAEQLRSAADVPGALVRYLADYLTDPVRLRTDAAFYVASMEVPELRPLADRYYQGLVQLLSGYTSRRSARAIAIYVDGLLMHAVYQPELEDDDLSYALTRLMENPDA
ncbi:TetR/AcrR family transcriptional regulator [Nakamurella aerolata]|uniref:TetR family transcriptional regulator n=1 Tax=Nakamurella aerolata TaxID=1656892 RepID=A0A849AB44_9ACTN|nr:TetR family transcriptional regulator [Nakamurella aerolata]NNG36806.1 TetR family transcriptional regulator [Nakamurella aerolata]